MTPVLRDFARAALLIDDGGDASSAGVLLAAPALAASPLANHVRYYRGLVALRQSRLDQAAAVFSAMAGISCGEMPQYCNTTLPLVEAP